LRLKFAWISAAVIGVVPLTRPNANYQLVVISPVYDDAIAAAQLLGHLRRVFVGSDVQLHVIFVDDGSPVPLTYQLHAPEVGFGVQVDILRLRRNVGHQRAIALGVAYVHEHIPCSGVLIMDADGEDRPEDAAQLVARCREQDNDRIIFAERTRRSESALFQFYYRLYQLLHWMLTGIRVRVGNFSVVPASHLPALVTLPALWNHYAAAIFQARLPRDSIPTVRAPRYSGKSKMNFLGLAIHGLQAFSVFIEVVAVRLLIAVFIFACGCAVLLAGALIAKSHTGGIATVLVLALAVLLGSFSLTLGFLNQRNNLDFIPIRDYNFFVEGLHTISNADEHAHLCGRRA
jgi:polyisoprenyl-phosphate glycosyltransferase